MTMKIKQDVRIITNGERQRSKWTRTFPRILGKLTQEGKTGNTEGIKQIQTGTKTKKRM